MKTLIITDTETTGLDPKVDRCIEVAYAVYDVDLATMLECFSSLLPGVHNDAEAVNRIPSAALRRVTGNLDPWTCVRDVVDEYGGHDAAFIAHRASFDRSFYNTGIADSLPWICSKFDIEWPLSKPGASLVEVALAHGVPVHDNHRALTDVMLLVRTFQRVAETGHDVQAMLARAMRPKATYAVADTAFDPERNKLAKANAFSWEPNSRLWIRTMAKDDVGALPFAVREVSP